MKKNILNVIVFPTWVLVGLMRPFFPKDHIWKNKRFSLSDWAQHSTPLNYSYSVIFWVIAIYITVLIIVLSSLI